MNTEKKKYRFNAIDLIIIIVILAVVAFCAYKMVGILDSAISPDAKTYTVTLEMKKVDLDMCQSFEANDPVYTRTDGTYWGHIVDVQYSQSKEYTYSSETGSVQEVTIDGKYDITFVLEIKSAEDVAVGTFISFRTNRAVANGYAHAVELKEVEVQQ